MGLVGPLLTRSNAEWHSALQTKSRDEKWDQRDRLSQLPVEESGGLARSSGGRGPGSPDSLRRYYSYHHLILLILFHPALREGVPRETRGGDTPPRFFPYGNWDGGRGRRPPGYGTGPVRGTRLRDVHGHKVPLGTSVGTLNILIDK